MKNERKRADQTTWGILGKTRPILQGRRFIENCKNGSSTPPPIDSGKGTKENQGKTPSLKVIKTNF